MRCLAASPRVRVWQRDACSLSMCRAPSYPVAASLCQEARRSCSWSTWRRFKHVVLIRTGITGHTSFAPATRNQALRGDRFGLRQACAFAGPLRSVRRRKLHPELDLPHAQLIIRKGFHQDVDSYSAFWRRIERPPPGWRIPQGTRPRTGRSAPGRHALLRRLGPRLDARTLAFDALVTEDACRAIDTQGSSGGGLERHARGWSRAASVRNGSGGFEHVPWSGALHEPLSLGARNGQSTLCAVRRPGRRIPEILCPCTIFPKLEHYPDGQNLPTPQKIDFKPGQLLGCVSGELGLRKFLEEHGHTLVVTSDKDGPAPFSNESCRTPKS